MNFLFFSGANHQFRLATFRSFHVINCIFILYTQPFTYVYKLTYTILRRTSLPEIAAGTTRGNLASVTRSTRLTYLPLLINFLQVVLYKDIQNILRNPPFVYFLQNLLASLLSLRPGSRLSAEEAKAKADTCFELIFSADNYFRPKIRQKPVL